MLVPVIGEQGKPAKSTPGKQPKLPMPIIPAMDRRSFVSRFVVGSVSSLLAGKFSTTPVLGTILDGPAGVLKVKISDYPALQGEGGSIQLTFSGATPHPLMINRGVGNTFYVLDSDCQHNHCVVPRYNPETGRIRCSCHGSQYAIDGSLLGGPALRGLNTFASSFDGVDTLSVTIPGLFFSVTEIAVQATLPSTRLRLKADILPYSTYRVFFQQELAGVAQAVPFASGPTDAATLTSAFTTTTPVAIYVDAPAPRGFYTVALVATPY